MLDPEPSPELSRVQRWLSAVMTEPRGVSVGIRRAAELSVGVDDLSELERLVTRGPELSALERLAIYNDGYFARLVECLVDDYPAVQALLGTASFERVAREYIAVTPSRSPSLNAYGQPMAAFLRGRGEPWAPFAAELATLEWALVAVIHAESKASLDPAALGAVRPGDWSRARLVASPTLQVLAFSYPVNRCFQAFREHGTATLPAPERSAVAVHRSGLSLYRFDLEPPMERLLTALVAGEPLGVAIASLERTLQPAALGDVQARLSEWFGTWVSAGFFTAIELLDAE